MTVSSQGPFSKYGPRLLERGYSVIPIAPGTKYPGELRRGEWSRKHGWQAYVERLPSHFEMQIWCTYPDAGIGVVCGAASKHLAGIDIDTDNIEIKAAIVGALPPSTLIKRGAKGGTHFFRAPTITKSKSWTGVCDLIGPGRLTVLPPSIHPNTGQPYVWIGGEALEDTNPGELPELTQEHIDAIDAALTPFGYVQKPIPEPERDPSVFECSDRRGREYALAALHGCGNELARTAEGARNNTLNAIAYRLGRMAGRLWIDYDEIGVVLWNACCLNGSIADDGQDQFIATFNSGYRDGFRNPAPDPRERLKVDPEFAARIKLRGAA